MKLLPLLLALFTLNVMAADMVARDELGNMVTLHDTACAQPWMKKWKQATFKYQGKTYSACWLIVGATVVVLDSSGDITPLPAQAFIKETGV